MYCEGLFWSAFRVRYGQNETYNIALLFCKDNNSDTDRASVLLSGLGLGLPLSPLFEGSKIMDGFKLES